MGLFDLGFTLLGPERLGSLGLGTASQCLSLIRHLGNDAAGGGIASADVRPRSNLAGGNVDGTGGVEPEAKGAAAAEAETRGEADPEAAVAAEEPDWDSL